MRAHPLAVAVAFVLAVACSPAPPSEDYQYGEGEMAETIAGTWRLTVVRADSERSVTFTLVPGRPPGQQDGGPGPSPQCGHREFPGPGIACAPTSSLYVAGEVLDHDATLDAPSVSGWYLVAGLTYNGGGLELQFGPTLRTEAGITAQGDVINTYTTENDAVVESRFEHMR